MHLYHIGLWDKEMFVGYIYKLAEILPNNTTEMNKTIFLILFSLISFSCKSQNKINEDLKSELDSILMQDQIFREYIDINTNELRKKEIENKKLWVSDKDFKTYFNKNTINNGSTYIKNYVTADPS